MVSRSLSVSSGCRPKAAAGGCVLIILCALSLSFDFEIWLRQMKVKEDISVRQITKEDISEENMVSKMHDQYQYMYNQRRALINESSVIDMQFSETSYPPSHSGFIDHFFGKDIQEVNSWKDILSMNETARNSYLEDFANPGVGRDLLCGRLYVTQFSCSERRMG